MLLFPHLAFCQKCSGRSKKIPSREPYIERSIKCSVHSCIDAAPNWLSRLESQSHLSQTTMHLLRLTVKRRGYIVHTDRWDREGIFHDVFSSTITTRDVFSFLQRPTVRKGSWKDGSNEELQLSSLRLFNYAGTTSSPMRFVYRYSFSYSVPIHKVYVHIFLYSGELGRRPVLRKSVNVVCAFSFFLSFLRMKPRKEF